MIKSEMYVLSTPNIVTGCVEWDGLLYPTGYGRLNYMGGVEYTHRIAWIVNNGDIPDDNSAYGTLHVLHRCDNPRCINIDHLFLGTHQDNMRDRDEKGRGRYGENRPSIK